MEALPELPENLLFLYCHYNNIKNLDNLPPKLTHLNCSSNKLVRLENLPFELRFLNCSSNQLVNLDYLPNSLEVLICNSNAIEQFDALPNSLTEFGLSEIITSALEGIIKDNIFLAVLITLGVSSLLSAFLAGTPVTIILLPIFSAVVGVSLFPNPIIIAFISGVNLAGNFLPQGSACDMLTLTLAKKYRVTNLNYKRLLKNGFIFATLHFSIVLGYTIIYALITGL